ncbi:MAG: hypothetical protein NVSMB56_02090 [Pyrinomonadaceae bacterium]
MLETKKVQELEVVELTEDLPDYDLKRGELGTIVEVFDVPEEAYMIEFVDESGTSSKLADWVKPNQFRSIDALAKGFYERGKGLLDNGRYIEAARELRQAIELKPSYISGLHNSLKYALDQGEDAPQQLVRWMRFIILLDPSYQVAKNNLAISYLNWGVKEAKKGNYKESLQIFNDALSVESAKETQSLIRQNIAASYIALGIEFNNNGDFENTVGCMVSAYHYYSDESIRRNLTVAYVKLAEFYLDKYKPMESSSYFQKAEDAGFIQPDFLNDHAVALVAINKHDDALLRLETASAMSPDNLTIRSNIAKLKQNKTNIESANQNVGTAMDFHSLPFTESPSFSIAA